MEMSWLNLCVLSLYLISTWAKPQTGSGGSSNSKEEPKVAIEEQEIDGPQVHYDELGEYKACGFSSKQLARIAEQGSSQSNLRDWPWMVVLLKKDTHFHFCGGVLITPRHVLTASHCIYRFKAEELLVRLGEYDFKQANESPTQDIHVKEIRNHDDWDVSTYEHDIAILYLAEPVKYSTYIQPVCLPLPTQDFTNTTAVVVGWGATEYGGQMSHVLMETPVPIWQHEACVDSFSQTIFSSQICAAGYDGGKDACQGDSGGPLFSQRDDGRWLTMGVVSWGIRCGEKGKPGVYTKVSRYLDWIAQRIQDV